MALPPSVQPCAAAGAVVAERVRKGLPETWHPFSVVGEGLEGGGKGTAAFVVKEMGELGRTGGGFVGLIGCS